MGFRTEAANILLNSLKEIYDLKEEKNLTKNELKDSIQVEVVLNSLAYDLKHINDEHRFKWYAKNVDEKKMKETIKEICNTIDILSYSITDENGDLDEPLEYARDRNIINQKNVSNLKDLMEVDYYAYYNTFLDLLKKEMINLALGGKK